MRWIKRVVLAVGALLALLLLLPFVVSVDDYRPRIERELSTRLKEPVTISRLRAHVLPTPHATAEGIRIGKTDDVRLAKLVIEPDVLSLRADTKVIRAVELSGLRLTQAGLQKLAALGAAGGQRTNRPALVRVTRVKVMDASISLGKSAFGPFDANVVLRGDGAPERITLALRDGTLNASVVPGDGQFAVELQGKGWRLPVGAPVLFDELAIKGVATVTNFKTSTLTARLYGGAVNGHALISWDKGVRLNGTLDATQLDVAALAALASSNARLSGRLNAKPVVSATSSSFSQLGETLRVESPFQISNGVLHGVDIRKAATSFITKDSSGDTRFEQLSGHLVMAGGSRRLSNLKVAAGALAADGNVTIAANRSLSGRINAQLNAGAITAASVPLNVSGTLDSPLLLPTAGAVAGAVAGTAVLGPAGTAVGARVGGWVEGLFGGGKK